MKLKDRIENTMDVILDMALHFLLLLAILGLFVTLGKGCCSAIRSLSSPATCARCKAPILCPNCAASASDSTTNSTNKGTNQ